jgi:uroporphyrinogen decarboxylase
MMMESISLLENPTPDSGVVESLRTSDGLCLRALRFAPQGSSRGTVLIAGGRALDESVDRIKKAFDGKPYIFNLGHGILPETPIAHVEQLVARVRGA